MVAVKLTNQSAQKVVLDPRQLQGQFVSATFQHQWLDAKGTPEDTTTVYLVMKGKPDKAFPAEPPVRRTGGKPDESEIQYAGQNSGAVRTGVGGADWYQSCQPDTPVTGSGQDNLSQSINDLDRGAEVTRD